MIDLKSIRSDKGLTQQELADECGVGRTTICQIELGVNHPSVELAKRLGERLGVDWTGFFGEE